MKTRIFKLLALTAGVFVTPIAGADFDGSEPLMCSFGQAVECIPGSECRAVTNESVDAPDFVKLEFRKKEIVSTTAGVDSPPDDIDNVVDLASYLVVQGAQGGSANDTLGWSLSINHSNGQMVATGSGENAGFVIFGACSPL